MASQLRHSSCCGLVYGRWSAWKVLPRLVGTMHNYAAYDKWNAHNHPKYFHDILPHFAIGCSITKRTFSHFFVLSFSLFVSLSRKHIHFFPALLFFYSAIIQSVSIKRMLFKLMRQKRKGKKWIYIYIYVLCALIVREKNGDNDYLFAAINPGFLPHVLPQPNTYVECVILNAANDNEICTLTQRQPHIAPTQTHSAYSFTSAHIHHANIVNKQQKGCST